MAKNKKPTKKAVKAVKNPLKKALDVIEKLPSLAKKAAPWAALDSEMTDRVRFSDTFQMDFETRAGLKTYRAELQERLQDIEERQSDLVYILPLKVPKSVYRALIKSALETVEKTENKAWTEQDEIHRLIKATVNL